jgi:hypothetical protein
VSFSQLGELSGDTDRAGWYKENAIIEVIFTELRTKQDKFAVQEISNRVTTSLNGALTLFMKIMSINSSGESGAKWRK